MHKFLADLTPKSFLLILFLITSLVVTSVVIYDVLPKYKSYVTYQKSFHTLNSTLNDSVDYQSEMNEIQIQVEQLQKRLNGEGADLPFKQFESHVIAQLQQLAWKNSIELGGVRPRTGQMLERYHEILFDVELSGEYFDLYRFLLGFEDAMGFIVINDLHISPLSSNQQSPSLKVEMSIASYREGQL